MPNYNDILNTLTAEASDFINNPDRLDRLLLDAEKTLRSIPTVGDTVSGLPVMIAMVKSWVKNAAPCINIPILQNGNRISRADSSGIM